MEIRKKITFLIVCIGYQTLSKTPAPSFLPSPRPPLCFSRWSRSLLFTSFSKITNHRKKTNRAVVFSCTPLDETFQQSKNTRFLQTPIEEFLYYVRKFSSQFFRTTTGIQLREYAFDQSKLVMTIITNLRVTEILCSFRLVLEEKTRDTWLLKIWVPRKVFNKQFCFLSDAEDNTYRLGEVQQRHSRFAFVENTISNSPEVPRAKLLGSDRFFCFISNC